MGLFSTPKNEPAKRAVPRYLRINRDPNNQLDVKGLSIENTGLASHGYSLRTHSDPSSRGEAARAALNYQHMSHLGSSESARRLQESSFQKMNNMGGGFRRPFIK